MVLTDEEKKKERNEYMRLYNLKNKDRLNAKQKERHALDPTKKKDSNARYLAKKKLIGYTELERIAQRATSKKYRGNNPEKVLATKHKYYASEAGKACKIREEVAYKLSGGRAASEKRRAERPLSEARSNAKTLHSLRTRESKQELTPFDRFCISEAIGLRKLRKELTGIDWHIDHIKPVSKGGMTTFDNIQVVPAKWNQSKSNLHNDLYFTKHEVAING